ncbi:S-adenosyl-L-methionine-dependent tRNA 4-demethylwyosine synthase [Lonchura striata]|uniref:S-adenosyl-L-methionine-dependent tRNA 4-demethylwyosine synthase n=1 Tax=Lonchura striata TaxID=40157 RepID=A0A218ULP8_9PASE|nr:S-adenosyl-L-methionine-dependent tRNA 4-demethylwyosine synthase [Lonchura striata domestica]
MHCSFKSVLAFPGVSGVKAARLEEALAVKHCALSLVGEPIMYPHINSFVRLLHQHGISTFLVTNAQFPEEIRRLEPVTQLYVSVDASTKESLRRIDRPLFKDFWQRFLDSLKALAEKQQRTVYRLTLVKAWNVDELKAYADLISLGKPDFIEVKGVTYCGESSASSLTMANVPWHGEVVSFVRELARLLPDYGIACEHEHSNCLLLAHSKVSLPGEGTAAFSASNSLLLLGWKSPLGSLCAAQQCQGHPCPMCPSATCTPVLNPSRDGAPPLPWAAHFHCSWPPAR